MITKTLLLGLALMAPIPKYPPELIEGLMNGCMDAGARQHLPWGKVRIFCECHIGKLQQTVSPVRFDERLAAGELDGAFRAATMACIDEGHSPR